MTDFGYKTHTDSPPLTIKRTKRLLRTREAAEYLSVSKWKLRSLVADGQLPVVQADCVHGKYADDFVFTREDRKPVRVFRKSWRNVCTRAGVPRLLFHDLRRTAARDLRRAGVAENVIMQIGGWRTRSVFDRYAIITENDIADAVRKLETDRKQREAAAAEIDTISHESVTKSIKVPTQVEGTKLLN